MLAFSATPSVFCCSFEGACQNDPRRVPEGLFISQKTESVTKTTHCTFSLDFYQETEGFRPRTLTGR